MRGKTVCVRLASRGSLAVSSIRSLLAPGLRIRVRRSRIVGRASCTSGRSLRRNGARSLVAGFDSPPARRGRRASSAGSRTSCWPCAACPGSSSSARSSATFSSPIAAAVVLALPTSEARSSRRSAIACTVCDASIRKRSKVFSSSTTSRVSRDVVESAGLRYLALWLACLAPAAVPGGLALDELLQPLARLRVEGVEELVEVHRGGGRGVRSDQPPVGHLGRAVGPRRERHVAVGDPRQRRGADRGRGARWSGASSPSTDSLTSAMPSSASPMPSIVPTGRPPTAPGCPSRAGRRSGSGPVTEPPPPPQNTSAPATTSPPRSTGRTPAAA